MMFFNRKVQILRSASGSYDDDGNWQEGVQQTLDVIANVQPLNTREIEQYTQILAGGNRTISLVKVYTNAILLTDAQMTGQKADILLWLGKQYKIAMQEEWQSNIISHFRYIGVEVVQDEFSK
jgi:hypothetical protein